MEEELNRVLESPAFRNSPRSKDFLSFVVAQTLLGAADSLKERTIGAEVFGKHFAYDVNEEPVVRVRAGDIRKRLGMYYAALDHAPRVFIDLPAGAYVPRFRIAPVQSVGPESVSHSGVAEEAEAPRPITKVASGRTWILLACALLIAGPLAFLWSTHSTTPVFDKFWEPVLKGPQPIILSAAYTPVYLLSVDGTPPHNIYTEATSGYLGGGDLVAASQVAGMLGAAHHPFVTRIGDSVSFQDLSTAPSVLIGYSQHFWDPLTKDFRYTIRQENGMILDGGKPTSWVPHGLTPQLHVDDDYAIVVRTFHPQTHEMMILICGSEQYGTQAAGELITNPGLLAEALKDAPRNWQSGNLQLVLHTKIVNNSPAVPQVVAKYYW